MRWRSVTPMWVAKIGYLIMSLIFCLSGLLLLVVPRVSAYRIASALGITLTVFGIVKLIGYFSKDLFRLAFQYDLPFGILLFILGMAFLLMPERTVSLMLPVFGSYVFFDGVFRIRIAKEAKDFGIMQWRWIRNVAVITGISGIALILRPVVSVRLLGFGLFAEGALSLIVTIFTVKIIKKQYPDQIEERT